MTASLVGTGDARIYWEGDRDQEGHRSFKLRQRVKTSDTADGPFTVMNCAGLPSIGSTWSPGNDSDPWAFCWPNRTVRRDPKYTEGEAGIFWIVESLFSTKPLTRCQDETIEDPLAEPDKLSGGFTSLQEEILFDRSGDPIQSSAREPIRGIKKDKSRPTVNVSQNVASLGLGSLAAMVNTLNNATLWGLAPRCVKLSNVTWERKLYGICNFYYTRHLEFEIDPDTFDEDIADAGSMILVAGVQQVVKDPNGENKPKVWLDGAGAIAAPGSEAFLHIEKYNESNFLLLGIPTSF